MKKILVVVLSVFAFSVSKVSYGGESDDANYCWDTTNYPHFPAVSNPWIKGDPKDPNLTDCAKVCAINENCWEANYWRAEGFDLSCNYYDRVWDIGDLIETFVFVTPLGCANN